LYQLFSKEMNVTPRRDFFPPTATVSVSSAKTVTGSYPVDGGVFEIPADGGEVVIPIEAKLPVGQPTLFAVTVEPPGGVVVSSRERIVLVAQPAA
jgi:hypothetical protein